MSRGFSIVELLVVMTVIIILSGISVFYLSAHQRLYRPDEQSLKIIDVMQEARQRSLTQRETMRVEIDLTDNIVRLIDENGAGTESDDVAIKATVLLPTADVRMDQRPPDILNNPAESMSVPPAQFKTSIYPPSVTHNVCTFRFLKNGTVVNEGTNPIGANAVPTGATLFIWSPAPNNASQSDIARAITVIGATGSVRLWEYNRASTAPNKWQDSRRTSVYGGN